MVQVDSEAGGSQSSDASDGVLQVTVPRRTPGDSNWFTQARFGMFIHWGLYAMGARDAWAQEVEHVGPEAYADRYFSRFDPDLYDPEAWATAAAAAGMRYVVVTAKHHEGFCLWDSKLTVFTATHSPAKRDLLRPLLDAFRARGIRVGLYYSVLDWHHPDFTVDSLHPLRRNPDRAGLNADRDMGRYTEYLHGQVRELLTDYGRIDVLWADFSYDIAGNNPTPKEQAIAAVVGMSSDTELAGKGSKDWNSERLIAMARELQPGILINDRLGLPEGWDLTTPEQVIPIEWPLVENEPALWETCQTFSGAWGYHRDEATWKSLEQTLVMLIDVVSKGGNLLLNVGPTSRGEFDHRVTERLDGVSEWMHSHSRAIYGCTQPPKELLTVTPVDCRLTFNPTTQRLYVHLLRWPTGPLVLRGLKDRLDYAQLLHDGSELKPVSDLMIMLQASTPTDDVWLALPTQRPPVAIPVIELFLRPPSLPARD